MEYFNESLYGLMDNLHPLNEKFFGYDITDKNTNQIMQKAAATISDFFDKNNQLFKHHHNVKFSNLNKHYNAIFDIYGYAADAGLFDAKPALGQAIAILINEDIGVDGLFRYLNVKLYGSLGYFSLFFSVDKSKLE